MSTERDDKIDSLIEDYQSQPQRATPDFKTSAEYDPEKDTNVIKPEEEKKEEEKPADWLQGKPFDRSKDFSYYKKLGATRKEWNKYRLKTLRIGADLEPIAKDPVAALEFTAAVPISGVDFGMDAIGAIPGLGGIDDAYDEATKFQDPVAQKFREVSSVIMPTMMGVGAASGAIKAAQLPKVYAALSHVGSAAAIDAGVTYLSDTTDDGDNLLRGLDDLTGGSLNIPDSWMTLDSDSTEVRKKKNTYEAVGLSIIGDVLGYGINLGKALKGAKTPDFMGWFKVGDELAEAYKKTTINYGPDLRFGEVPFEAHVRNQSSLREWQMDEVAVRQLELDMSSTGTVNQLMDDAVFLGDDVNLQNARDRQNISDAWEATKQQISANPQSRADVLRRQVKRYTDDAAKQVESGDVSGLAQVYSDKAAKYQKMLDDELAPPNTSYNPAITPKLVSEAENAVLSVPPASVARNALDVAAIKSGISSGNPAPIVTEPTLKAIAGDNADARDLVMDVAADYQASGEWAGLMKGFEFSKSQMDTAARDIWTQVMEVPPNQVKDVFYQNPSRMVVGGQSFEYASEDAAAAALVGIKNLTDMYLGESTALASARVMDTTARELQTIAEGAVKFPNNASDTRIQSMILDRMQILMSEHALNKFVSGFALQNKKRIQQAIRGGSESDSLVREIMDELNDARVQKAAQSLEFRNNLETLWKEDRAMVKPFIDAFTMSNGDINSLDKMMKWANKQMSLRGLFVSPTIDGRRQINMLTQGLWAVRYNNVLSGLSALRAGIGNTTSLILKSTTAVLGHGIEGTLKGGDYRNLKRALYIHGAFYETNRRAAQHAWDAWKRSSDDPQAFMDLMRKDRYVARDAAEFTLMEDIANNKWNVEGNKGKMFLWNWTKFNNDAANSRYMRWGTNAMIGADQYVNVTLATHKSRMLAYEEVFEQTGGKVNKELLRAAEEKHFAKMFDKNGVITDEAVKKSSSELALNQDDQISTFLNNGLNAVPALKPLFMFPRTGVNAVKLGLTYTPFAAIPGSGRMALILNAGTDQAKIFEALAEHGVKRTDPNAMVIFENLKAEYKGRMALGGLILSSGFAYALGGNIRGNGPINAAERKLMRDNYGWKPKHIKVGNKWVSYAGVEPFDSLLTPIADLAYYATDIGSNMLEDFEKKLLWSFAAGFTNKTFMAGLDPLIKLLHGDETQFARLAANEFRTMVPMSGAVGVFANAISSSQKDIHDDIMGYVANRVPGFNTLLPERIDVWTGKPINDIDNPWLRALNAFNPVPISDGGEPWRQWLLRSGWDGMRMLRKDSTGKYEYTPAEREELYKIMGKMGLWKKVEEISKSDRYNNELDALRRARADNVNFSYADMRAKDLNVYRHLNSIIKDAQKTAEMQLLLRNPPIEMKIEGAQMIKHLLGQGKVEEARKVGEAYQVKIDQVQD